MTLLYHSSPAENARLIIPSIWSSKLSRIQALSWIAAEQRGSSAKRTFFHYNFKIKLRIYYKHDFFAIPQHDGENYVWIMRVCRSKCLSEYNKE